MKIDVVVPVYNEQLVLKKNIAKLHSFLKNNVSDEWRIIIANNASSDDTLLIAQNLKKQYKNIRVVHLDQKGRGRALKKAWGESAADIMCYMDVDLATGLDAFPVLIKSIKQGAAVATGNRYDLSSSIKRKLSRLILSYGYSTLARLIVKTQIRDLQCGFKAISRSTKEALLPLLSNPGWFFDTELLVWAEKLGYPIAQIPVR